MDVLNETKKHYEMICLCYECVYRNSGYDGDRCRLMKYNFCGEVWTTICKGNLFYPLKKYKKNYNIWNQIYKNKKMN